VLSALSYVTAVNAVSPLAAGRATVWRFAVTSWERPTGKSRAEAHEGRGGR
jgi:hypothetical protein